MNKKNIKIYLDNCCYNRPFDDTINTEIKLEIIAKLAIQEMVKEEMLDLQWSYVLTYENSKNPKKLNRDNITRWKDIASANVDANDEIISLAKKYQLLGATLFDALHVACAVNTKCDYFLTTDKKLIKKNITDIKVMNPIDFLREVYDYGN